MHKKTDLTGALLGGILGGMSPARRSPPHDPLEKTGYRIPRSLVRKVREAVETGQAKSQNEFVERALRRELRAEHWRRLNEAYEAAAADPDFMAEMLEEARVWDVTVGDGLRDEDA
jgi:Arc/MetJ-type ribon-helix-helix transcriptional regulator